MNFERYTVEFAAALDSSNNWGLPVDDRCSRHLREDEKERLAKSVWLTSHQMGPRFMNHCGAIHTTQRELAVLHDESLNPVVTIGWLDFQGEPMFETTRRKLKREIKRQAKRRTYDTLGYHAWLTLRDGDHIQIIDCTLGPTCTRRAEFPEHGSGSSTRRARSKTTTASSITRCLPAARRSRR
jgi:hypothetical protein